MEILNTKCIDTLMTRGFFEDVRQITTILKPIKNAIEILESKTITLADCFFQLCQLVFIIKYIPTTINIYENFQNYCIDQFNER